MDCDDLCTLQNLDEENITQTLKERFLSGQIYTNSGLLMLSINPYRNLDIYSRTVADLYKRDPENLKPHIYALLENVKRDTKVFGEHSIIVSGESGSGKTECSKKILEYLGIPVMRSVDLILESMGNAQTANNSNSSRFGKLIRLKKHVRIDTFLLEKSRVTSCPKKESNFHIFYCILGSRTKKISEITGGFQGGFENDYIRYDGTDYSGRYLKLKEAFEIVEINFEKIENFLIGIICLGSLKIKENGIEKNSTFYRILDFLELKEEDFEGYLTYKTLTIGDETIKKVYSPSESTVLRDSLSRLLYSYIFNYVVKLINEYLLNIETEISDINILDIFGFEDFEENGLDQFCINWCNEKIYDEFVNETFLNQKNILLSEGVVFDQYKNTNGNSVYDGERTLNSTVVEHLNDRGDLKSKDGFNKDDLKNKSDHLKNNNGFNEDDLNEKSKINSNQKQKIKNIAMKSSIIDLIERRCGIVDLIAEESFLNGTAESLGIKLKKTVGAKISAQNIMEIEHFAGVVKYKLDDFILKNKERGTLSVVMKNLTATELALSNHTENSVVFFKNGLNMLFSLLKRTKIKYVKCIRPNTRQMPGVFDEGHVRRQLQAAGVLQSVEISRYLYPHSMFIDDFEETYGTFELDGLVKGKTRYFFNNHCFNILEYFRENRKRIASKNIKAFFDGVLKERQKSGVKIRRMARVLLIMKEKEMKRMRVIEIESQISADENNLIDNMNDNILLDDYNMNDNILLDDYNRTNDSCIPLQKPFSIKSSIKNIIIEETVFSSNLEIKKEIENADFCENCQILQQKYKIQSLQLQKKQNLELELERMKNKLKKYEDSSDSVEAVSASNMFACLIQLYLDYCPVFSSRDIPKDEILSLAHLILFTLKSLGADELALNLSICLDEISKRVSGFCENLSVVSFVLSNLIELKILICANFYDFDQVKNSNQGAASGESGGTAIEGLGAPLVILNELISSLFAGLCDSQKKILSDLLPGSVLEYQHLKEFRVRESIYKKLFSPVPISKTTGYLEYFYDLATYFYIPDSFISNNISFLLSFIDFVSFNSMLAKKKFLNRNRCMQITYNLSEIEKFCFNISFHQGFYNMAYMREAVRVAMGISRREGSPGYTVSEVVEKSFLNINQINTIIDLFENCPATRIQEQDDGTLFIDEPKICMPDTTSLRSVSKFLKPKYIPEKSIKSILNVLKE